MYRYPNTYNFTCNSNFKDWRMFTIQNCLHAENRGQFNHCTNKMTYLLKKLNFKPILSLDKQNLQYTKLEAA